MKSWLKLKLYIGLAKPTLTVILKMISLLIPFKRSLCTAETKRCEVDFFNKNYKNSWFGLDSAPCCNRHLYEILKALVTKLESENIDYYIFYGTLLGLVRHQGGFIPWDTDVDLCIMEKDRDKVQTLIRANKDWYHHFESVNENWDMLHYSVTNKVHADIYYMSIDDGYIYLKGYESIQYRHDSIFPTQLVQLYNLEVRAPADLTSIKEKYGQDFSTVAYRQYALFQRKTSDFHPAKLAKLDIENDPVK